MQLIQHLDENTVLLFQHLRCDVITQAFNLFIPLQFWFFITAILILYFLVRQQIFKVPVLSLFFAWNFAKTSYSFFKDYFHRPRPFLTIKGIVPLISPPHDFSFPSGHATVAAAMTVVLAYHFPRATYLLLTLVILVGISRIYFGVHYASDVLGGFMLGIVVGIAGLLAERVILSVNKGIKF